MDPITEEVMRILVDELGADADAIAPDARFEDLDLDSLVLVELSVILQRRYGTSIREEELTADQTVADAAALVRHKAAAV
ncbi:acyl carrier protein [Actinosynnema sp. NPDC053489]|uniref:acyl carrier protein n=1 Tax=Actinosynnema sp. NPDC053489 TaxID=3363916 RepID=UPI0037C6405E